MLCEPAASELVEKVATPDEFVSPDPSVVAPSMNVTVSPGPAIPFPGAAAVTVAVKVTDWPNADGFGKAPSATEELALFTVCATKAELVPIKFVSGVARMVGSYTAVIWCVATANEAIGSVATPDELVSDDPILVSTAQLYGPAPATSVAGSTAVFAVNAT